MTDAGFALEEWQIRLVLPHRFPVLMLDRIAHCSPCAGALEALKALSGNDVMMMRPPGLPAYLAPGALIEGLAQCCGLLLRLRWLAAEGADLAAFANGDASQIDSHEIPRSVLAESQSRFMSPLHPGQMLRLSTRLLLSRGDLHRFEGSVHGTTEVAAAQIMLKFPYED